jgi:hypothetical protein
MGRTASTEPQCLYKGFTLPFSPIILVFLGLGLSMKIVLCETTNLSKYMKDRGIFHLQRMLCLGLFNKVLSAELQHAYRSSFLCPTFYLNKFSSWFIKVCKVWMKNLEGCRKSQLKTFEYTIPSLGCRHWVELLRRNFMVFMVAPCINNIIYFIVQLMHINYIILRLLK